MARNALSRAVQEKVAADPGAYAPGLPLVRWFEKAREGDLWRINAWEVANALIADRTQVLTAFIRLARDGILDINWDFHCTECNAVAGTHRHLSEATASDHCPLCNVDFRNTLDANVEVTFTPAGRLFTVSRRFLAEQTRKTVEAHAKKEIRLPGLFVSGMDCLHVPLFREIFESETLSLRESLRVGQACIMFTDIKGSTVLYDRLGDSRAYGLIRDHFDILFRRVEQNGGVIVKTIGDSVMASFKRPVDGVAAALSIQTAFADFNRREAVQDEILVKIGLHAGATIMVNLNNRLDYFGQVVNMAARIQGTAGGGDIVVSSAVRNDPAARERLARGRQSITRRVEALKGISGEQEVFSLKAAS